MAKGFTPGVESRGLSSDEKALKLVKERKDHSVNYHRGRLERFPVYYDWYRGVRAGKTAAYRNAIHIPILFAAIQADVARKVQTSFGAWPIVSFSGYGLDDSANAKRNETLISAQMKDSASFMKAVQFFICADIYGTAIARYGWKNLTRKEKWRVPFEIAPGVGGEEWIEKDVTHFNGPDWSVVDPLDFWPQPGKKHLDEMDWVIHRYYVDLDNLKAMAAKGTFNKEKLRALEQAPNAGVDTNQLTTRLTPYRTWDEYSAIRTEPMAKPIEVWEYWGLVPDEMAEGGFRNRVIAIGAGRVVLKNWPNPLAEGRKPFHSYCPMEDPHYFHGVGKVEIGEKMQGAANRIANQKLDALDLFIDPTFVASSSANINVQNLFTRPGKIITVDGAADESSIRALVPNLNGLQYAYNEITQLRQFIQEGTGMTEAVQGLSSTQRETARGFLGRQENAMTRLMLEARLAEEGFVEPLANSYRALNRQYLPLPHMVKILGDRAFINPITGMPLPQEPTIIMHEDVNPDYRARAVGATQMIGKNIRQQNVLSLLQAMSANPALMQLVNWANFSRQMFELFDFPNVTELLNVQNVPLLNTMAADAGMSPENAFMALSQPLDQLNPETIGAFMGGQSPQPIMGVN